MRVAALCDIHGMLVPLAAVLDEVAETDVIVVGGDVVPVFRGFAIDRGER